MVKKEHIGEPVIELFYSVIYFVLDEKTIFGNLLSMAQPYVHGPCMINISTLHDPIKIQDPWSISPALGLL